MTAALDALPIAIVLIPLTVLWAAALFHIFAKRPDLSPSWKGIWSVVVLLLPYVGVLIYAMLRPPIRPGQRAGGAGDPTTVSRAVDRLRTLADEHERGQIDDEAYEAAKREIFGLTGTTA